MPLLSKPTLNAPRTPDSDQPALHDARLEQRIERALKDVGCHPLHQIRVSAEQGQVILNGTVPTYYLKQIAQSIVMRFDDVLSLKNNLIVR